MELLVTDARVWAGPDAAVGEPTSLLLKNGIVAGLGPHVAAPSGVRRWSADGRVVAAGFWNCHVHFTGPQWRKARSAPAAELQAEVDDMLLSRGFTTVLDLASDPRITGALIRRIAAGELRGPEIVTAATAMRPWLGTPYYVKQEIPWYVRWRLPNPATAWGARRVVARQAKAGARLTKLFTGSYVGPDKVKPMRLEVARAAVEAAHARGMPVLAHPSNREGAEIAVTAGVDALAHVPDETAGVEEVLREAAAHGVRMVPTLYMFASSEAAADEGYLGSIRAALQTFIDAGGRVLFGTDVGYLPDPDTRGEYAQMSASGMDAPAILRSLTAEPAAFLGRADAGVVAVGQRADLTVFRTRTTPEPADFADIAAVIRSGELAYEA